MSVEYDKYYKTENLFGNPYPELLDFYTGISKRGKLLDLGCGQGRDAVALAKLGFEVTGMDNSTVGIEQLNEIAKKENLPIKGIVADIYQYSNFETFDFILLDSMFHFGKREKEREVDFLKRVINGSKSNALITICIQNTGKKLDILMSIISDLEIIHQADFIYKYEDKASNHHSETKYGIVTVKK